MADPISHLLHSMTLQDAAKRQIAVLEKKLREEYGISVRCGVELEFFVEDANELPFSGLSEKQLKAAVEHIPQIERVYKETGFGNAFNSKFEITFKPDAPGAMAATVDEIKQSLPGLLKNAGVGAVNFAPAPHNEQFQIPKNTTGLHINISLWDNNSMPLFFDSLHPDKETRLLRHCAFSLMQFQRNAFMAFVPTEDSFSRLSVARPAIPKSIAVGDKDYGTSVFIRSADHQLKSLPSLMRLENRLPGGDADPYVAIAATLAAMYHAVKTNLVPLMRDESPDGTQELLMLNGKLFAVQALPDYFQSQSYIFGDGFFADFPKNTDEARAVLTQSPATKLFLGTELQQAIIATHQVNGMPASKSSYTGRV